jgi:hypothetical protein
MKLISNIIFLILAIACFENVIRSNQLINFSSFKFHSKINNKETKLKIDYSRYDHETNQYFNEIARYNEFKKEDKEDPIRWSEDMKIFVDGEKKDYLMEELRVITDELNEIINPIEIQIVSKKSEANFNIYLGHYKDFDRLYDPYFSELLVSNRGFFEISGFNSGIMYVDVVRTTDEEAQKHLLREELTQSLGLTNDSWKYPESIFYQGWTTTTTFTEMDKRLIDLLYN